MCLVDLVWNAILASQAQRKESVFEENEGVEEEKLIQSAFDESKSVTFSDTELVISIDNIAHSHSNSEVDSVASTNNDTSARF